jgi:chaperone BCS1
MDVWVEFRNASKWQAEALFRNFFPSTDDDNIVIEGELEGVELPGPPQSPLSPSSNASTLWSMSPSFSSSSSDLSSSTSPNVAVPGPEVFGAKNQAYMPPPVEEHIAACQHSAKPLDGAKLAVLAKKFADSIPNEEFSVAALQGYLLKNKSQPESAANDAPAWVISEREMRERLRREQDAREVKERIEREKRRKEQAEKEKEKAELEKKELELARIKLQLQEKEMKEKTDADRKKDAEAKAIAEVEQARQSVVKLEASADHDDSDDENENLPTPSSTTWVEVAETSE